jgi:hypothetical protein
MGGLGEKDGGCGVRTNVISNGIGGEKQGNKRKERIDERESARRIGFRGYRKKQV